MISVEVEALDRTIAVYGKASPQIYRNIQQRPSTFLLHWYELEGFSLKNAVSHSKS